MLPTRRNKPSGQTIRHLAVLTQPFMPRASGRILDQLAVGPEARDIMALGPEGHDSKWTVPHNSRVAHYTNLRPGSYRFHVIACNNHGYWNEQGDEFSFVVEPRFHETWPFYGLCALGLFTGAAGVQAVRLRLGAS